MSSHALCLQKGRVASIAALKKIVILFTFSETVNCLLETVCI